MNERASIAILGSSAQECEQIRAWLQPDGYQISVEAGGAPGVRGEAAADLYVVCLSEQEEGRWAAEGAQVGGPPTTRRALFVLSSPDERMRLWAHQRGAVDVMIRPLSANEVRVCVERALAQEVRRFMAGATEQKALQFLGGLIERGMAAVEPALDPAMPRGHFYPQVAAVLGRSAVDVEFLEGLADEALLTRRIANTVRLCPVCDVCRVNYREVCPRCGSVDLKAEEIIHHFACGRMAPLREFVRGSELHCSKCGKGLRHIGLDYEKPTDYFACRSCELVFNEPRVQAQCLQCGCVCDPEKMAESRIYRYELTPLAEQAVEAGRIAGVDLSALLHNAKTGLYSRQYFEHELEREFARSQRHKQPFSLLMIRVENLQDLSALLLAEVPDYLNSFYKAVSQGLRKLDLTCVWSRDTLGALLPGTDEKGARTVADRMQAKVADMRYPAGARGPQLAMSIQSFSERLEGPAAMVEEALKELHTAQGEESR